VVRYELAQIFIYSSSSYEVRVIDLQNSPKFGWVSASTMNLSLRFFSNKLRIATYKSANLLNSIWKISDPVEKSDNMLFNANDPRNAKLWRWFIWK
jgi:hypothetical protein